MHILIHILFVQTLKYYYLGLDCMAEQGTSMRQSTFIQKVLNGERDFRGVTLNTQDTALQVMQGYVALIDYCQAHDPFEREKRLTPLVKHPDLLVEPFLLDNADFSRVQAPHLHMPYACGKDVRFKDAKLEKASFHHAQLPGADFRNAQFQNADLRYFWSPKGYFLRADFSEAVVAHANLVGAHFSEADPRSKRGVSFVAADLSYACLAGAYLTHANFTGAVLDNADLLNAWAQLANFERTSLKDTKVAYAKLEGATFIATAYFASVKGLAKAVTGVFRLPKIGNLPALTQATTLGSSEAEHFERVLSKHKQYELEEPGRANFSAENEPGVDGEEHLSLEAVFHEGHSPLSADELKVSGAPTARTEQKEPKRLRIDPDDPDYDDFVSEFDNMSDDELLGIDPADFD
jgi:uncharacterized protein YjbI with pentapeptide repeats